MKTAIYRGGVNSLAVWPWSGVRAWLFQLGLVIASVLLPAAAHLTGAPVRWLLPMHWPVILAGLLYGWRGGLTVGLLAPGSNWLLTGYPLPIKLLPMTVELAVYGFVAGWLVERWHWNRFAAVAVALVAGRMVFLAAIAMFGATDGTGFWAYVTAAMVPGLAAGVGMVVVIPVLGQLLSSINSGGSHHA